MSKRISPEERIISFFEDAHIERATAVHNMVKAVMKKRNEPLIERPKQVRKKRKSNAALSTASEWTAADKQLQEVGH